MQHQALQGGFTDAPVQAARAFREALTLMARPGTIGHLDAARPPAPISAAAGTLLLTLCDPETPVYLAPGYNTAETRDWIAFHCGAPLVGPDRAQFAVGQWEALLPLDAYATGTAEFPDRSATLIVELPALSATGACLTGPGIRDTAALPLPDLAAFQRNAALFPLGLDFFFTAGTAAAALPRSTRIANPAEDI
ncbi:MAG: phosphonate C-P lyase system protein PhnH [Rhodobacteraceae bacterium]|nr:phosphonate C-P lyase system protein PhnH [Paracoccaceae bacterium]